MPLDHAALAQHLAEIPIRSLHRLTQSQRAVIMETLCQALDIPGRAEESGVTFESTFLPADEALVVMLGVIVQRRYPDVDD